MASFLAELGGERPKKRKKIRSSIISVQTDMGHSKILKKIEKILKNKKTSFWHHS